MGLSDVSVSSRLGQSLRAIASFFRGDRFLTSKGAFYRLCPDGYEEIATDVTFPRLTSEQLNVFLNQRQTQSENQVIRTVRQWIQSVQSLYHNG